MGRLHVTVSAIALLTSCAAASRIDSSRLRDGKRRHHSMVAAILNFGPTIVKDLPESPKGKGGRRAAEDSRHLISFYGHDCEMCSYMVPLIQRIERETGMRVRRFETWSHPEHEKLRALCDTRSGCGGVPFFYNKETKRWICGATTYDNLRRWALGKPCAPFLPPPTRFKAQEIPREPGGAMRIVNDLKERGKEAMEERQKLAEEQRKVQQERSKSRG